MTKPFAQLVEIDFKCLKHGIHGGKNAVRWGKGRIQSVLDIEHVPFPKNSGNRYVSHSCWLIKFLKVFFKHTENVELKILSCNYS